ncbi:hypothetical protein PF008_g27577 [Phytophthora fragariae]|uniref:Reverse transcriptase Ty1/copia-type domain-containing protein n=1 Tax=Phytophthora fragariae TaxID=53985 RepID=A0A6G0QDY5_9STRA|nr:hypothetical protein PF008_g27577 [Phytophthora fragariae]
MMIPEDVRRRLGVDNDSELVLELLKALYGLKQAGLLWNQLLHKTLIKLGFAQGLTDMCVYHRRREGILVVVGVYVDGLMVTGMEQQAVDAFFGELTELSIKDLGPASKFLGMRVSYNEDEGYDLDQSWPSRKCCVSTGWHRCTACVPRSAPSRTRSTRRQTSFCPRLEETAW